MRSMLHIHVDAWCTLEEHHEGHAGISVLGKERAFSMITTTLADLPGKRPYEVLGVVIGIAHVSMRNIHQGSSAEEAARRQMEARAESMGADAIIDIHLQMEVIGGTPTELAIALIGTAIKFA